MLGGKVCNHGNHAPVGFSSPPCPASGSTPVRVGQLHRSTRPQFREGERRQTNNAAHSVLPLALPSNQAGVSRQMQLMANCGLIRGIYTAILTFKGSTILVNRDMKCKYRRERDSHTGARESL